MEENKEKEKLQGRTPKYCTDCKKQISTLPTAQRCKSCARRISLTPELKAKLSLKHKGVNNPWYGKAHTEAGRLKISLGRRGKMIGENHPKWKGGRSKGYKKGYYSLEYKQWRESVFIRDNFTCQECGDMGYITAHHIKSFAYYPHLRFDINNGKTLCESCHSKTDNYKGRARKLINRPPLLTKN